MFPQPFGIEFAADWHSPSAIPMANRLEPPELKNGSGIPMGGKNPLAIMTLTLA